MKTLLKNFREMPLAHQVLVAVEALALVVVALVLPSKPAHAQSGEVYATGQAQVWGTVREGTVLQVAQKRVEASTQSRVAGGSIGAALGALLATQANGRNAYPAAAAFAVVGGVAGERVANSVMAESAQEIIVELDAPVGQARQKLLIVQPAPYPQLAPGDAIYVTAVSGAYRVIPKTM